MISSLLLASACVLAWGSHAYALWGEPRYAEGFSHFDYVNAKAPKGGELRLASNLRISTFDKYNPFTIKGSSPAYLAELMFDTLLWPSLDETATGYGLLAEDVQAAADGLSATFRLRPQARVCGQAVDNDGTRDALVPHQVEIARREAESRALTSLVDFSIQDYTQTIFDDASFDVVWACESLCHAGRKKDFYREAYRLLKPGGRLVIAEYIRRGRNLAVEDEAILQTWCSGWSMPDLDTWDEHWSSMQEAGFTDIDPKDVTAHVSPSLNKLFKMSKSLLGLGKFLHFTKIRNDVMHGNQVASVAQFEALSRNLWYYCIYSATKPTVPL